jgi:rhodanese-related sulfurtransferase
MSQFLEFVSNHFFLVGAFVALLVLFVVNEGRRGGRTLSAQQLVNLVNRENAVVLDVRDRKDYAAGHIVDAINIPFASLESRVSELERYKDRPIVVTCNMGQHAGAAGATLAKAGFGNVARLGGGMNEWRAAQLPVVKGG